ncbi:DUF805 domain-containing protein [Flavobacterium sp. 120]|uniref:DUF805 domain-containing protein n=1 Tax=Flavobacterium sp. 120 TaxID=2135626 RepID=UPI000EB2AFA0|nr:DUF805 domain-containing protein [Flavobacterium sp. 120]RKS14307.1 uncharacterized membrane protein YhaH (DUF805 family) [Flavobacterium sp. 120]
MFKKTFSFDGRIRRTEYGLSLIFYFITVSLVNVVVEQSHGDGKIFILAYIPALWFLWAQGAKRCHDMDKSGWFQIIPFYVLWMLFIEGDSFLNKYGGNPKLERTTQHNISVVKSSDPVQLIIPVIYNDSTIQNNVTNMEVRNVNYSNFQDVLRQLRNIPFVKSLNNTLLDSTGSIVITHDNTTQYLSNEFKKTIEGINIVDVSEGIIIIKIK